MILMMMYMVRMTMMNMEMVMMLVKVCLFEGDLAANLLLIGSAIQIQRLMQNLLLLICFHSHSDYSNLSTKLH